MCALPDPDTAATRLAAGPVRESAAAPGSTEPNAASAPVPAPSLRETSPGALELLAILLCLAFLAWPIVWLLMEVF